MFAAVVFACDFRTIGARYKFIVFGKILVQLSLISNQFKSIEF